MTTVQQLRDDHADAQHRALSVAPVARHAPDVCHSCDERPATLNGVLCHECRGPS